MIRRFWPGLFLVLMACHKDDLKSSSASSDDTITKEAANNFSLFLYYSALTSTGYNDTLALTGPFTVLGPSNAAFQNAGFNSSADIIHASDSILRMMPYLILRQRLAIDSTPMGFNQELTASNGQKLYLTHWVNERDTAVVVNGVRISTLSRPASNGLTNIADGLIYPSSFADVKAAVSGDANLTFFNAALIQSGLADQLKTGGPYTIFAPVNQAFTNARINSVDDVYNMDPSTLKALVQAHIVDDRRFIYDYILKADVTTNSYDETMADGSTVTMMLIPDRSTPGRFTGVTLSSADTSGVSLVKPNVLAGNGVVHSINTLLNSNL